MKFTVLHQVLTFNLSARSSNIESLFSYYTLKTIFEKYSTESLIIHGVTSNNLEDGLIDCICTIHSKSK